MSGREGTTYFTSLGVDRLLVTGDAESDSPGTSGQVLVSGGASGSVSWAGLTSSTIGLASTAATGLVGTAAQAFAGIKTFASGARIKGRTDGVATPAGDVGQTLTTNAGSTNIGASGTEQNLTSFSSATILAAGRYLILASGVARPNGATMTGDTYIAISTNSASSSGSTLGTSRSLCNLATGGTWGSMFAWRVFDVSTTQAVYLVTASTFSAGGPPQVAGGMVALRIG